MEKDQDKTGEDNRSREERVKQGKRKTVLVKGSNEKWGAPPKTQYPEGSTKHQGRVRVQMKSYT